LLGIIDWNKKPEQPRLYLTRPNREIIAELSEAYNIRFNSKIIELNDLEFDIPFEIDINHQLVKNKNVDLLKERYLIYMEFGNYKEWFIIVKITDSMDEEGDSKTVFCYSLAYQLKNKLLRGYQVEAKDIRYVLTDVLAETPWGIGTLDADFETTYRSFDFSNTSVLDAIYQIGETYNAVIEWDTVNRLVSFIKPELHGIHRGIEFSYGHYLKTMGKESNADEMVTRLKAFGKDGMSINGVNPIGQNYIQDFSYFMYPFERDANGQVIQHSYYMSDSLCHALLDYEALVESKKNEFNTYLTNKENLQSTLSQKEIEMVTLKNQEAQINEIVLAQQFDENMWFHKFVYNGTPVAISQKTKRPEYAYVVLCKVSQTSNITVSLDGIQRNLSAGSWVVLGKVKNTSTIALNVNGTATNVDVFIQIANITTQEYDTLSNENALIEKYCLDHKQMQISQKQLEINTLNNQIESVNNDIEALRNILAMENNFTTEQLDELSNYIIEREFEDQNYIDPHDLYEATKEKFEEFKKPQMIIDIDIVNFKEVIEEQGNWDKLVLGDYVTVVYERMNTKVTAKIIEISYDFEDRNIQLRIANIKDISDENRKLERYIYRSIGTSTTVSLEKNKWGKAVTDVSEISKLFDNLWDKITNEINMASNEYVVYDRNGLTIFDPNDSLRFLRATHGALALTRSGGLRYETAITPDGIIAERLFGKILLTQRVTIGDDDGILEIHGAKATITDRCNREVMKFGLIEENPDKFGIMLNRYSSDNCNDTNIVNRVFMTEDDGFKIQRKSGLNYIDMVWLDLDGYFHGNGIRLDYVEGTLSNGISIDPINGIIVTRSDGLVRSKLNATEGIGIERFENGAWVKKLFFNISGEFRAEDLVAKRLRIVNDFDDLLLDSNTNYLNIGRFQQIITDGKLTPIEKLTLKQEWETIQTEYQKILYQAQQYQYSARDGGTISHINIPPFTAAYVELGNYITPLLANMNETTTVDRTEFTQKFQNYYDQARRIINEITDALKYSSLLLGVPYNKVTIDAQNGILVERSDNLIRTKLNATEGISIERNNGSLWTKKFYVDLNGILHAEDLVAKRLKIVTDPFGGATEDVVLIDAEQRKLYLNNFDIIGAGTITAQYIIVNTVTADDGFIANLTVNKLKTLGKIDTVGMYVDFINAENNTAKWITGQITSRAQATTNDGTPLYWTDASKSMVTTKVTSYPVYNLNINKHEKLIIGFDGTGLGAYPYIQMGEGSGTGNKGKSFIYKYTDLWEFTYYARVTEYERNIFFEDSQIRIFAENGAVVLEHSTGSKISISENGNSILIQLHNGSSVTLSTTGLNMNITGAININATGQIKLNGSSIHLN